jgi:hypothetical protein
MFAWMPQVVPGCSVCVCVCCLQQPSEQQWFFTMFEFVQ